MYNVHHGGARSELNFLSLLSKIGRLEQHLDQMSLLPNYCDTLGLHYFWTWSVFKTFYFILEPYYQYTVCFFCLHVSRKSTGICPLVISHEPLKFAISCAAYRTESLFSLVFLKISRENPNLCRNRNLSSYFIIFSSQLCASMLPWRPTGQATLLEKSPLAPRKIRQFFHVSKYIHHSLTMTTSAEKLVLKVLHFGQLCCSF